MQEQIKEEINMSNETVTTHVLNSTTGESGTPETATRATRVLKKRGRKGNKIAKAFDEIPGMPVDFVQYAQNHSVSPNVLRQIKRHDRYSERGKVFVRKNKETKKMMIWRDTAAKT